MPTHECVYVHFKTTVNIFAVSLKKQHIFIDMWMNTVWLVIIQFSDYSICVTL